MFLCVLVTLGSVQFASAGEPIGGGDGGGRPPMLTQGAVNIAR